ncbi:propionyl-CoA carboxylase subunit alpha [Capsaspora owczarzaki ATCC 30864]|uniref:Propionyl-CoA carboxylase subunit alpha n=1 Tax=Capsaspora owczarzaki (strain ATCC 30864) TaxID=595528 RepID=A0A0D2UTZ1_CAPO3|nr:propionyl-CoA carboxylase subunit alpha [Capsaspora owczarzaki ATCC 30864]KJE98456.1 propionyl-CoA carboxylase subunit alpha [Capsaspora owczarzaki ATCC 30864]|eukprot:XP_004339898.1 propionyl-CoA carboxylase subunit alpha [Capsaspora owczarzaki ATCC 30864]
MICKLITYGPDRQSALQTMREALDSYVIRGVTHNIPILRDMIDHPRFISGDISTKFIQEEYPTGFAKRELKDLQLHHLLSTAAALKATELVDNVSFQSKVARQDVVSEVASGVEAQEYVVLLDGAPHRIILSSVEGMSQVEFEDGSKLAVSEDSEAPTNHIRVRHFIVEEPCEHEDEELVDETAAASEDVEFEDSHDHISDVVTIQNLGSIPGGFKIGYLGGVYDVVFLTPREYELSKLMPKKAKADTSMMVVSPMPGTVVTIAVSAGDSVRTACSLQC